MTGEKIEERLGELQGALMEHVRSTQDSDPLVSIDETTRVRHSRLLGYQVRKEVAWKPQGEVDSDGFSPAKEIDVVYVMVQDAGLLRSDWKSYEAENYFRSREED